MIWLGQASEHDADHGETDEGCDGAGIALEVAREAAIVADPSEGAFDDPTLGQDDELVQFVAFDNLDAPTSGPGSGSGDPWSLIAGIGEDALDEREQTAGAPIEDQPRAVAILHVGGMDHDVQEQAERVDENVPLAARDLLARIEALRVERGAPF
jgi:hypothetical protein